MKISYQWLKRYIPQFNVSPEELAEVLPSLGLEVEAITYRGLEACERVVVGEILSKEKHPHADRLSLCTVSIGPKANPLSIVCGAQNHKAGDKVPVALEGAVLARGFTIQRSTVRGIPSEGMLCSAQELGLAEASEGLLILEPTAPLGAPLSSLFPEKDAILDLGITPNRGDALSHVGLARCLSAYYQLPLTLPSRSSAPESLASSIDLTDNIDLADNIDLIASLDLTDSLGLTDTASSVASLPQVRVLSSACPYYIVLCIEGISVKESPKWLQKDLEAVGLKPINNIVDITNWVMLELGQPLHAFDATKIQGQQLEVRSAKAGETLHALNDKTYTLNEALLVIADSQKPLALAGVIGGSESAISNNTSSILLESAYFEPSAIRKSTQRLGLNTDSAYRFVRNVDPNGVALAASRAAELILQLAGGKIVGKHVYHTHLSLEPKKISLSYAYILDVCGFQLEKETIIQAWERLGCTVKLNENNRLLCKSGILFSGRGQINEEPACHPKLVEHRRRCTESVREDSEFIFDEPREQKTGFQKKFNEKEDCFEVEVPTFLRDVERPIDLIEELIRIYGTHHIPDENPKLPSLKLEDDPSLKIFQQLETYLLAQGFSEAYNYTTVSQEQLLEWQALLKWQASELLAGQTGEKEGGVEEETEKRALTLLALANPLNQEHTHLRSSLIPGLLKTAQYNLHQKTGTHRFFERGKTFHVLNGEVEERFSLACILLPKPYKTWEKEEQEDFYTVKKLLESLLALAGLKGPRSEPSSYRYETCKHKGYQEGYAARVLAGKPPGHENMKVTPDNTFADKLSFFATLGTLNLDLSSAYDLPQTLALEMSFSEKAFKAISAGSAWPQFQSFSSFPGIAKDLCLVVDKTLRAEAVQRDIEQALQILCPEDFSLKHLRLFDLFQGMGLAEGQKSLGFEMEFASNTRTLKEAEVNSVFNDLQNKLETLNKYIIRKTA